MKNPIKAEINPHMHIEAPTLCAFGSIKTEKRPPKRPDNIYINIYLQVPIKYSNIVPITKIAKQLLNICSKPTCNKLCVNQR